jgi:hypothetical protein
MSDLLDVLFDQMRDQRPPVPFAPPDLIRRRGRQRAHLQVLGVGAAVLAVAGVGVCLSWLVDLDPTPSPGGIATSGSVSWAGSATPGPTASATAARTDVSPTDMLQPSDLGVGTWTPLSPEGVFKGADQWYWADLHEGYRPADYRSRGHQLAQRVVRYEGDRQATVEEIVERYEGGWAARNVADIQAVVARSGATPYARPGAGAPLRHEIVDTDVAGDESLLIEQKPWSFNGSTAIPQSDRQLIAVVRVGNLVATVIPQFGAKPEVAAALAVAAAERLR